MSKDKLTAKNAKSSHIALKAVRWSKVGTTLSIAAIVLSGIAAYCRCMPYPFIFDDEESISENPYIHHLWPPTYLVSTLPQSSVAGRPMASLTLALNYHFGGLNPWGYRALNLAIHLWGGFTLFGIIRRTLCSSHLHDRFGRAATPLALAATLIWVLHPLQTESVTYVIQRCESLMGLFFLLTLFASIRAFHSSRPIGWKILAVIACALGMATKESMATAPLLVLLYDRAFVSGSFKQALRSRGRAGLYSALAGTWIILIALVASGPRSNSAGFGVEGLTPLQYALSQPGVLVHYLSLAFWPHSLCLDYWWPMAQTATEIVPPMLLIVGLLAASIWAFIRRPPLGYLGAWFFLILGPTSSVVPIIDLAFEHRMYLSLAAISIFVVIALYWTADILGRRLFTHRHASIAITLAFTTIIAVLLGIRTAKRNEDYRSGIVMWEDVVSKRPTNPRAYYSLARNMREMDRIEEGIAKLRESLKYKSTYSLARGCLAVFLAETGNITEALEHANETLRQNPEWSHSHSCMGIVLDAAGRYPEALECYQHAEKLSPDDAEVLFGLAHAYWKVGQTDSALQFFNRVLQLQPQNHTAHYDIANLFLQLGFADKAASHYIEAMRIKPDYYDPYINYAGLLFTQGKTAEAIPYLRAAVQLKKDCYEARLNLAQLLRSQGENSEANSHFAAACGIALNEGDALFAKNRFADAAVSHRKATRADPKNAEAFYKLGCDLMQTGQWPEAVEALRQTLQLDPSHTGAIGSLPIAEAKLQ